MGEKCFQRALDREVLKHLALMGGLSMELKITSGKLGRVIGITQQAASRRLISLEEEGYISRHVFPRSQMVRITQKGKEVLLGEYSAYQQIFFPVNTVEMGGRVVSGSGRGRYFMEMREYSDSFSDVWGFRPFPGTLNVKVEEMDVPKLSILRGREGVRIPGFTREGRSYGDVLTFETLLKNEEGRMAACVSVLPLKSEYHDVVEIVARSNLRMTLGLEDGEMVFLEVKL